MPLAVPIVGRQARPFRGAERAGARRRGESVLRPLENLVSDRFALHRRHAGVLAVAALLLAGTASA